MNDEERITICVRRGNPPPITGWKQGDECRVDGYDIGRASGRIYDARILTVLHNQAELYITASAKGFDGKPIEQKWVHPKPVPLAKLKKPLLR